MDLVGLADEKRSRQHGRKNRFVARAAHSARALNDRSLTPVGPQHYCCGVLPDFDSDGTLPPGIHPASWDEVVELFGCSSHRTDLLAGLLDALSALRAAGCRVAYLDGSFVTNKEVPGDYDLCWETAGVDLGQLDPVFFDLAPPRAAQQARYRGDLLPNVLERGSGAPFLDFFQNNKVTGGRKGIVSIVIEEVKP